VNQRPDLSKELDNKIFNNFYYLKEELIDFCRKNELQITGNKKELTDRITYYLDTGKKVLKVCKNKRMKMIGDITLDTIIEKDFICSEKHREFYKNQIGDKFSFNVIFQKWLKTNPGKTYRNSIDAYYKILEEKKLNKTTIDKQFEYNVYIRDFFEDNKGKTLGQAIKCWKYKKSIQGHNKYEKSDLKILRIDFSMIDIQK